MVKSIGKYKLPDYITLGYTRIRLVLVDSKISTNIGEQQGCYVGSVPYTIYLDKDIMTNGGPDAVNLIIHECMHHIWTNYQVDDKTGEEITVNTMANGITELVVRSELKPWLIHQLQIFGKKI